MKIKINNATVLTNNRNDDILHDAQIHIEDETISYVGRPESAPAFAAEREIDAAGKIAMPGFFNAHTHVPMTLFRCFADDMGLQEWLYDHIFPAEEKLTDEMVYWASLAAMCEFAAAGVVGYNEMYSNCGAIAKATTQSGIRATIARGVVSFTDEMAEEKLCEALDVHKTHHGKNRINVFMSPHAQYTVNNKTLERIAGHAKDLGTGIHVHLSETRSEHEDCIKATGKTPAALFEELGLLDVPVIAAHCVWVSDEDIEILARHDVTVASCPRSNLKLASGIAPVQKMLDCGVKVALGTDSAASNNKLSMMSEMGYACLLQKAATGDPRVIPARQAIRLATLNGAQAMGFHSGVIEAGWNADIILLDNSGVRYAPEYDVAANIVYAAQDSDVCMTIVGGDIIYESGACKFADVNEVRERLATYAKVMKG